MIYENDSKKCAVNSNKPSVNYPLYEKLILDNNKIALITHETDNKIRIGLVCNTITDCRDLVN
jgi:hypothetical protein